MILLLLILVVTSTGLANRQSSDGFSAVVRKSETSPRGPSQERLHMASQRHTPVDITCEHKSGVVCRFSSVTPSIVMDTRGGTDWWGKDMDGSLAICLIYRISFLTALIAVIMYDFKEDYTTTSYSTAVCFEPAIVPIVALLSYALGVATKPIITAIYSWYDRWWRQPIRMKCTRNLIETDEYPYKYPVFVTASSYLNDAELRQLSLALERQLQIACWTERQLVCSRDHFTPGESIFSETTRFLDNSGMMIIVVSSQYNECEWCEEEFKQARMLRKPIFSIQYGEVEKQTMNPNLIEIIRENVRITVQKTGDSEYNITPGWQTVCNVILQLLPCRLDSNRT